MIQFTFRFEGDTELKEGRIPGYGAIVLSDKDRADLCKAVNEVLEPLHYRVTECESYASTIISRE